MHPGELAALVTPCDDVTMIIGHYAVGFLASRREPALPLWQSMIGVVWLDILHSSLVLLGPEQAAVVPGITAVVPIDLIHYPISHSLVASLLWSAAAFALYWFGLARARPPATRWRASLLMAACVFSHFVLDLVAHRADLPLVTGEPKYGFGLWNHVAATFMVENVMVFGAAGLYLMREGVGSAERYAVLIMCVLGSAMFFTFPAGHFPDDIRYVEAFALLVYALVPAVAYLTSQRLRRSARLRPAS